MKYYLENASLICTGSTNGICMYDFYFPTLQEAPWILYHAYQKATFEKKTKTKPSDMIFEVSS